MRGDKAATALSVFYDEAHGAVPFVGKTYGDEGSGEFAEAFIGLLTDLRHLAARAGMDYNALDRVARERWHKETGQPQEG
jgi:hypothetical protein